MPRPCLPVAGGIVVAIMACSLHVHALHAQAGPDTLRLGALQQAAESHDARAGQRALLERQGALRARTIREEWRPSPVGTASAQYLSDVASVGAVPGRAPIGPPNDQVDAYVALRAPLWDPTRSARLAVEQARTDESIAGWQAAQRRRREAVNEVFFAALLRDAEARSVQLALADLDARYEIADARVREGAALPGDRALLDAERVRLRQRLADVTADARAAREQIALLTGHPVAENTVLLPPTVDDSPLPPPARARPEFAQFERRRELLDAQSAATAAAQRPRLVLTSRLGYGRPGLNALQREYDTYAVGGLALEWTPFDWGRTARQQEITTLQAREVEQAEAEFTDGLARAAARERATLDALLAGRAADDAIVALRRRVIEEARLRLDEGEITAADYVARRTELLQAELDRDRRQLRIADVRARYLTLLGYEIP